MRAERVVQRTNCTVTTLCRRPCGFWPDDSVRVVHHALPDMWLRNYPALPDKSPQTYVFGEVGYWNSRKNLSGLLEAYIQAFPEPSTEAALLLKTFNAGDVESRVLSLAGKKRDDIWIYDEQWSEAQMLWAFQMIDCYVAPTRGEAFGLAQAQAAALVIQ